MAACIKIYWLTPSEPIQREEVKRAGEARELVVQNLHTVPLDDTALAGCKRIEAHNNMFSFCSARLHDNKYLPNLHPLVDLFPVPLILFSSPT